jgi:LysM repeat protein
MMKQLIILTGFCMLMLNVFAQTDKATAYINKYKDVAMDEMLRSGVPAAITLAQGILESSYGESDLCVQSNNHFGIKCKTEWTGDKVYHDDDAKQECFRSYPDAAASFKDHSDFLTSRPWYASLFKLRPTDTRGWAYGLKKAGYATEKDYPQRLLKIISDYNLNQFTVLALNGNRKKQAVPAPDITEKNTAVAIENKTTPQLIPSVAKEEKEEVEVFVKEKKETITENLVTKYPAGVFSINHTKVIYARSGTSLLAVANQYTISLSRLIDFNELEETNILSNDHLLFLERKSKKGERDFHLVERNESLYDICQKEGVRMDYILSYNGIKKNSRPLAGEKVYLRSNAPVSPKTEIAIIQSGNHTIATN